MIQYYSLQLGEFFNRSKQNEIFERNSVIMVFIYVWHYNFNITADGKVDKVWMNQQKCSRRTTRLQYEHKCSIKQLT